MSLYDIRYYILKQNILVDGLKLNLDQNGPFYRYAPVIDNNQHIRVGLILNDCTYSSMPHIILTSEILNEQLQCSTKDFIDKCILIQNGRTDNSIHIVVPHIFCTLFDQTKDNMIKFIGEYSSNKNILCAIEGKD